MGQRWLTCLGWLTRPGWLPRPGWAPASARGAARIAGPVPGRVVGPVLGLALALAAVGQAIGQAVTLGSAQPGQGLGPGLLTFLYAFPLGALALLATVPPLLLRPAGAAVLSAAANVLVLALFPAPTVAGAVAAVLATGRLGAAGELRTVAGRPAGPAAAQYLAVGLAVPFLALALARPGDLACLLLAVAVPTAAGAGIAVRAGRAARTYSEAGEALADTLVAHTARGERARIARELHDVVAHHISMIAVQAETGRLTTPGLPEAGARRFAEIGDTARAGLTEMRRLLGVLREDAADGAGPATGTSAAAASRQPQPGLDQLAGLIDAAREASLAGTRLIISGPVAPLDPGVELAAYRIVQEALTNARRHAPGAAVDVELRYGPGTLRLRVRDNGPGPTGAPGGAGPAASETGASSFGAGGIGAGGIGASSFGAGGIGAGRTKAGRTGPRATRNGGAGGGRAGSDRAGSDRVGVDRTGSDRAVGDRAAGDRVGAGRTGSGQTEGGLADDRAPGAGHGLLGMRERAFSVGGSLYTGMAPGGGFLVEAVLPAEPGQAHQPRAAAEASR